MKAKHISIIGIGIIAFSCSPKLTPTTTVVEKEVKAEVALTQNQIEGKLLFETNCAKCHKLYDPSTYNPEKWASILKWMQPKARITDEQRDKIYEYVTNGM